MTTMNPCCARFQTMLARERGEITRLARIMARRAEKGQDVSKYRGQLEAAKANLAETTRRAEEHEADEHAGQPERVAS